MTRLNTSATTRGESFSAASVSFQSGCSLTNASSSSERLGSEVMGTSRRPSSSAVLSRMPGDDAAPSWVVTLVAPATASGSTVILSGNSLLACSSWTSSFRAPRTRLAKEIFSLPSVAFQSSMPSPLTSLTTKPGGTARSSA